MVDTDDGFWGLENNLRGLICAGAGPCATRDEEISRPAWYTYPAAICAPVRTCEACTVTERQGVNASEWAMPAQEMMFMVSLCFLTVRASPQTYCVLEVVLELPIQRHVRKTAHAMIIVELKDERNSRTTRAYPSSYMYFFHVLVRSRAVCV